MDEAAVRGALYGKVGYKRAERVRKGKKVSFKLKTEKAEKPQSTIVISGKVQAGKSIASMVREFLQLHKNGAKTSDVTDAVLKVAPDKYKAVGAALYNLKLAGKVKHDEETGVYTLTD